MCHFEMTMYENWHLHLNYSVKCDTECVMGIVRPFTSVTRYNRFLSYLHQISTVSIKSLGFKEPDVSLGMMVTS